jgi:NAD(P)H dehydrogenase (quinone)
LDVLVILAHPNSQSFNHAIAKTAATRLRQNGHEVVLHDLYAEQFDPLLPVREIASQTSLPPEIERHCSEISRADGIIIVHPNWWGQPPAILKGWVDRVMRPGVAYQFVEGDKGEGVPVGLLQALAAVVFNTANTPLQREREVFGDPLEVLWKNCIFDLCGIRAFYREMFGVVVTSTNEERQNWLKRVKETVDQYFPNEGGIRRTP